MPYCKYVFDGTFGEGDPRRIGVWQSIDLVVRTEEEEDAATVIRGEK